MKRCLQITGIEYPAVLRAGVTGLFRCMATAFFLFCFVTFTAAQHDSAAAAYRKVITERSAKIVNTLSITDSGRYYAMLNLLVNQYATINQLSEQETAAKNAIRQKTLTADQQSGEIRSIETAKAQSLGKAHAAFIENLSRLLDSQQIEKVKDGMTYRILPVTYGAYQEMLPALTADQKSQIYAWLVEARELAMDAESSDKKHAVFGKYKGRINNYLAKAGYDLKKETEAWQQRIKENKAKGQ